MTRRRATDLLTARDVMAITQLKKDRAYQVMREAGGFYLSDGGRNLRVRRCDLDRWLEARIDASSGAPAATGSRSRAGTATPGTASAGRKNRRDRKTGEKPKKSRSSGSGSTPELDWTSASLEEMLDAV